jgi:hypothetical protein
MPSYGDSFTFLLMSSTQHLTVNPFFIQLWNRLPEDALGTLSCKPNNFKKRLRKVINKAK